MQRTIMSGLCNAREDCLEAAVSVARIITGSTKCLLTILLSIGLSPGLLQTADARPNFVILLSDDMGWGQVGFNGASDVPTPNIDRIAKDGVRLTQFYVQPVCTPTRGCLLTGRYAWKNGTETRPTVSSQHGMLTDERTLADVLAQAGYATWMVGKWHLGEWHSHHLPRQRGFEHHYGHYSALVDSFTHSRAGILDWHRNEVPVIEEGYSTFLIAREAARLIRDHDGAEPFFLYVPFNAVHGPHQAPPEYLQRYRQAGRSAAQRAQLACMDEAIGQVLEAIKAKGVENDTLVMFTNDNGGTVAAGGNAPYRGLKSHYHEGGIRVPAVVRWPGHITAGSTSNEMLHVVDLLPTFCRLAEASTDICLPLDGRDAWKTMTENAPSPHDEIVHSLQVIRRGSWKLIEEGATYYGWPAQPLQLYNIDSDPYEKNNVAADQPEIVRRLRERLKYHQQFARQGETVSRIPGFPPVVYGQQENEKYGPDLRKKLESHQIQERDVTIRRNDRATRN